MNIIALVIEILLILSIGLTFIHNSKLSVSYWKEVSVNSYKVVAGIVKFGFRLFDTYRVKPSANLNQSINVSQNGN